MTAPQQKEMAAAINVLSVINKLTLKAFRANDRNALIFIMVNDTIQAIRYDRALLWSFEGQEPELLGASGQASTPADSELAVKLKRFVTDLQQPATMQIFTQDSFSKEKRAWLEHAETHPKANVLWMPIETEGKQKLGLWLERWGAATWSMQEGDILQFLTQAYGLAWEKFRPKGTLKKLSSHRTLLASLLGLLILLSWRVPLRVVAPCEVVPKEYTLVTAPLEEIVESVTVQPGQTVKIGDILFEYDKRVPLQNLKVAEEQVAVAREELNRAKTLAFKDDRSLSDLSVLRAKLEKEQANEHLAKYRASQLTISSPRDGIVMMDDPDQWRGKPVKVGEKVMIITDPVQTNVRFWVPESDNVELDLTKPITIYLNVSPEISRPAKIDYIANVSSVDEKSVPSFVGEAEWSQPQQDVKLGLKGTAFLYGDDVSLFYWLVRKPWAALRHFFGF